MEALVTGSDGLLGSHLVRKLLDRKFSVRALIQPGSTSPTLDGLPVERVEADLLENTPALSNAVRGCDFVFHCAAITAPRTDPDLTWRVNLEGTQKILDACVQGKVRRLIFTGSASTFRFGSLEDPGNEQNPFPEVYRGIAYMESKNQAMEQVKAHVNRGLLDAVIVAPTFLIGALDWRPSSGELMRQFICRGLRFTSPGGRNFAYAPDVAEALIAAAETGQSGECYIAGGQNLCYFDFFSKVAEIAGGVKPPRTVLPGTLIMVAGLAGSFYEKVTGKPALLDRTLARLSLYGTYYSSQKAISKLNMPQTPPETAIRESVLSLREYGHIP